MRILLYFVLICIFLPIVNRKIAAQEFDYRDQFSQLRIYQVMVEAFIDGDSTRNYDAGYGPSHHKGDLKGITKALPYIKSLGMNAIWLTPIFDAGKGTGPDPKLEATAYFPHDYFKVDPNFGSFDDAKEMVEKAHELGLYVFFDGVFGHHNGDVKASPSGKKPVGEGRHVKYPESLEFYKEVATYWIDVLEIDGWRLDQAQQVPLKYWKEIREAVEQKTRERKKAGKKWGTLGYMVAEVWKSEQEIAELVYGKESMIGLYSAFNFPMRYRLVQVLAVEENGKGKMPASVLDNGYETHQQYPAHAIPNLMLTNHDLVRFGDLIERAGYAGKEDSNYWKRHQAAFSFMAAYSGPITIYYGDEIGAEVPGFAQRILDSCWVKDLCDDHVSRTSGKISGFDEWEEALKNYLSSLMKLREAHPALWKGTRKNLIAESAIYVDYKRCNDDQILYILNSSMHPQTVSIPASEIDGEQLVNAFHEKRVVREGNNFYIKIDGLTGEFYIEK